MRPNTVIVNKIGYSIRKWLWPTINAQPAANVKITTQGAIKLALSVGSFRNAKTTELSANAMAITTHNKVVARVSKIIPIAMGMIECTSSNTPNLREMRRKKKLIVAGIIMSAE